MTETRTKSKCCEMFGPPERYVFVQATLRVPLRPEVGVFKRKKNVQVRVPARILEKQ